MKDFNLVAYCPGYKPLPKTKHASNYSLTLCGFELTDKWVVIDNSCSDIEKVTCPHCRFFLKNDIKAPYPQH